MKANTILCAALAATMGIGTAAQARDWNDGGQRQGRDHAQQRQQRDWQRNDQRNNQRDWQRATSRDGQRDWQAQRNWQAQRGWQAQPQYRAYSYAPQYRSYDYTPSYRSHSYAPRYWAGGYVPHQYRAQRYWVNDWRSRHLYAPPYGHQWVQTDTGEVLLIALATGLIASAILSQ